MVDCPSCGTECVANRRSDTVTIMECPDCEPAPLWLISLLALTKLPGLCLALLLALPRLAGRVPRWAWRRLTRAVGSF